MNAEAARGQPVDGAETLYRFVTEAGPGVCGCLSTGVFRVMLLLRSHPSDGRLGPSVLPAAVRLPRRNEAPSASS
jgi:hypothetical protein